MNVLARFSFLAGVFGLSLAATACGSTQCDDCATPPATDSGTDSSTSDTLIDTSTEDSAPTDTPSDTSPSCPSKLPTAGASCTGTLDCSYTSACATTAKDKATCVDGTWSVKKAKCECPASMPSFGSTCASAGMTCPYGSSACPTSCMCGTDLKWSCESTPCPPPPPPPPPPTDGGPPPPPPPPTDGGPSGCEDGVPCLSGSGCGSVCSSPAPPGAYSISCTCGTDGVLHCTKTPC